MSNSLANCTIPVEIYDPPPSSITGNNPNATATDTDDQAADDRIAEQFRREFMDAIQQRRQRPPPSSSTAAGAKGEPPKGPKLGGSRSARAAMRERELAAAAAGKK